MEYRTGEISLEQHRTSGHAYDGSFYRKLAVFKGAMVYVNSERPLWLIAITPRQSTDIIEFDSFLIKDQDINGFLERTKDMNIVRIGHTNGYNVYVSPEVTQQTQTVMCEDTYLYKE